ncbi:Short-chain dehydrogenase [Granulicella rosea]|uniref:Short-chain dehydrogenase n=1 Tax=Granulicella rosea TaxID=474952 RepID=A0A239L222_9BACT|nr:SDR family NAD(P)-dependent oxidoreductase [Granulicella rosea]SNT24501.1 Short-chain dehydrogenase [Granulicella rosea]
MKKSGTVLFAAQAAVGVLAYLLLPRPLGRDKVVLITGGSRGLGLALARQFGKAGSKLVLAARDEDQLEIARHTLLHEGAVAHEDDILLVACDVTDQNQAAGLVDMAIRTFGRLDILINNAGIIEVGPVEDQAIETYRKTMETNFFAALYTSQAALPHMLGRRSGNIVNIASLGGKIAVPHMLPYSAAKFALVGYSEGLHAELRGKGVRVTTVCPGLMRTGGEVHAKFSGQKDKEERWFQLAATTPLLSASADYAAKKILNAVAEGRAEITITPQAWLAARFAGIAPETTQIVNSLVNDYLLPAPLRSYPPTPASLGSAMQGSGDIEFADPSPS